MYQRKENGVRVSPYFFFSVILEETQVVSPFLLRKKSYSYLKGPLLPTGIQSWQLPGSWQWGCGHMSFNRVVYGQWREPVTHMPCLWRKFGCNPSLWSSMPVSSELQNSMKARAEHYCWPLIPFSPFSCCWIKDGGEEQRAEGSGAAWKQRLQVGPILTSWWGWRAQCTCHLQPKGEGGVAGTDHVAIPPLDPPLMGRNPV